MNPKTRTLFFAVSVNMHLFVPSFYTNLAVNWRLILGRLLGIFGWALRNVETCVEKTCSRSGENAEPFRTNSSWFVLFGARARAFE